MSRKHGFPDECDCASEDICQFLQRREEREQAMTPTPGEAAALTRYTIDCSSNEYGTHWRVESDSDGSLCLHADAQAIIDRMTADADELRRKWLGHRDTGHLSLIEAADQVIGGLQAELADRQAAALPTIEAIMDLADRFADAASDYQEDPTGRTEDLLDIARESLRAALARALPVGESELLTVIRDVDRLLTNLQPHIEQACLPGHAGFIDNYVDPALEKLRGALPEWKAAIPLSPDRPAEGTKP